LEPQHLAWYLHYLPIPFKASFGKARNGLRSTRIKLARFETRSGPEAPFVLGGPDWKRARFGLLPTPSGPESTPTSHPPDPIRIGAQRGGRGWRGTAREATAPRHGDALAASLSSPAFSPVSRYPRLPCPLLSPTLGFLLGFSPVLGFLDLAGDERNLAGRGGQIRRGAPPRRQRRGPSRVAGGHCLLAAATASAAAPLPPLARRW